MSNFEFIPTEKQIQESNIYNFMKKHNISSLEELSIKSNKDLEWYWKSVDEDIGIVWDKHYTKVLDSSKGIPWSKWFVDGKTNIYKSSVEKFT
ncbi:MAG TPA: acetyl-coenzyme A synthetase N-terminal domain-containing protein, partial [Nitrosopumilus sp.]|nr:acetyl-coenzyme A synthetase N-terminal domain-containing protein [Nitrosopumilus sp.]